MLTLFLLIFNLNFFIVMNLMLKKHIQLKLQPIDYCPEELKGLPTQINLEVKSKNLLAINFNKSRARTKHKSKKFDCFDESRSDLARLDNYPKSYREIDFLDPTDPYNMTK